MNSLNHIIAFTLILILNSTIGLAQSTNIVMSSVSISPDGTLVAGGGSDSFLRVWDVTTGAVNIDLTAHSDNTQDLINNIAWSPDSRRLAVSGANIATDDYDIRIWNIADNDPQYAKGELITRLTGHSVIIADMAWSPDGTKLATISGEENGIFLWDTSTFSLIIRQGGGDLDHVSWSLASDKLMLGYYGGLLIILDVPQTITQELTGYFVLDEIFGSFDEISWNPTHTQYAISHSNLLQGNTQIRIFDYPSHTESLTIDTGTLDKFNAMSWNLSGDMIAGYSESNLMVWNSQTGNLLGTYSNTKEAMSRSIAWDDNDNIWYGDVGDYPKIVSPLSVVTCDTSVATGDVAGLVSAVNSANGDPDATTICLEAGTYTLASADNTVDYRNALPLISTDVTLVGNGAVLEVSEEIRDWLENLSLIDVIFSDD